VQSRVFRIVGLEAYPHDISLASNIECSVFVLPLVGLRANTGARVTHQASTLHFSCAK